MIHLIRYWEYFVILGLVVLIPIAYYAGAWTGARNERIENEQKILLSSARNDVKTVSEVFKVRKEYEPIYIEIEKYVEAPKCFVPPVIVDTIGRLPNGKAAH